MRPEARRTATRLGSLCAGLLLALPAAQAMDFATAVRKAASYDPTTQAAHYAWQAGQEKGKQGTALYFPQITANASYTHLDLNSSSTLPPQFPNSVLVGNASGNLHGWGVTLVQPIYNSAVFVGAAQLKDQARLADLQKQGADMNLILRVAQVYFGTLMAEDNVELAGKQKAAVAQQLASAKGRFEAGKINIVDVRDAEARYEGMVAQEIAARNALAVQQEQFTSIVGAPPESLARVPDSFRPTPPVPDALDSWLERGRSDNVSVNGARIQVDVSKHEIDKYRLRGRPQLNLVASYTDTQQDGSLPILVSPDKSRQAIVGVQLALPLFAGGSYNSKYREAVAENSEAEQQLQATLLGTDVQVKQQYLNVSVGVEQIEALKKAERAAQSSLDATLLGQKVGTRTTLDVLNAQQQYFAAQQNLDAARYQYLLSRLSLNALVNALDQADVTAINALLVEPTP